MELFDFTISNPQTAAYLIFFLLVLCGMGLPIPEDIPLLALGFMWHQRVIPLSLALTVGFFGVLVGDTILYYIGRFLGPTLFRHKILLKIFSPRKINRTKARFRVYGVWVVFVGRFLMGLRAIVFFTAGATRIRFYKFFWMDCLAALISIPIWISLGKVFGEEIDQLLMWIKQGKAIALWTLLGIVVVYIGIHMLISKRQKKPKPLE